MTFRDRVIEINRGVGEAFDELADAIEGGTRWLSPFIPWLVIFSTVIFFVWLLAV